MEGAGGRPPTHCLIPRRHRPFAGQYEPGSEKVTAGVVFVSSEMTGGPRP